MNYSFRYGPFVITVVYSACSYLLDSFYPCLRDSGPTCYVPAIVLGTTPFSKTFYFVLGCRGSTMLWEFQMKSKGCSHTLWSMYPFSPPIQAAIYHLSRVALSPHLVGSSWLSIWHSCISSMLSSNNPMRRRCHYPNFTHEVTVGLSENKSFSFTNMWSKPKVEI